MKIQDWFENWGLKGLKVNAGFLSLEWEPDPEEEQAAWELYIELITRVATQPLADKEGDERAALDSIYNLFGVTRDLLKSKGRKAATFSKVAIVILNQKIRPFTAYWHRHRNELSAPARAAEFRKELEEVQEVLRGYSGLLATVAGVEDFLELEQGPLGEL